MENVYNIANPRNPDTRKNLSNSAKLKIKIDVLLYMFTSSVKHTFLELPTFQFKQNLQRQKSKDNDNLIRITQKCTPDFPPFVLTSTMCSFENIGEINTDIGPKAKFYVFENHFFGIRAKFHYKKSFQRGIFPNSCKYETCLFYTYIIYD